MADLDPWKDYEVSDAVWSVTAVKVHSNMGDAYLEGLKETWVPGNKVSKELGQIEDWWIYRSDNFMAKFTKAQSDKTSAYAQKNYPGMRDITGEHQMRLITIK
jgi:hypothetical protein